MKKILVTFGTQKWYNAQNKLIQSAKQFGLNGSADYNEKTIELEFYKKNQQIFQYQRGFGYWIWKPYCILKTLKQLNDGDFVIYSDSGSIFINQINDLFDICADHKGILLFDNRDGTENENQRWQNYMWTKRDCFELMDCKKEIYVQGNQVDACYQIYQKNEMVMNFLNEYQTYCENINIISDLPNITGPNHPHFREHRHDQSILSLLQIKHNIYVEREPSQWGYRTQENKDKIKFYHHRNPYI